MGRIIMDSRGLVEQPKDAYWDSPLTRREMQMAINQLSENDMALTNMCDTASIVLNFICEVKLGVKREELDAYVAQKQKEMAALQAAQKAAAEKAAEATPAEGQSDGSNV